MNAQAIAQVAQHLNVSPNQIKRCEEWATVLFVVVIGCKPRFVSKKVLVMEETREQMMERLEREQDARADAAEALALRIEDLLPFDNNVEYHKLFSAAVDILEGTSTVDEVLARFTSKKVITRG